MIHKAEPHRRDDVRRLWELSFHEGGPRYVDWFFDDVYTAENTLCLTEGGELLSVLQMIPYPLRLRGRAVTVETLCGVATDPAHKLRGHAKRLMAAALRDMADRGRGFTFLYPFDHVFYDRLGWSTVSYQMEYLRPAAELPDALPQGYTAEWTEQPDISALSAVYDRFVAGRHLAVLRDEPLWRKRLGELRSLGGRAVVLFRHGQPVGYGLLEESEDEARLSEQITLSAEGTQALLAALKLLGKTALWSAPADDRAILLPGHWIDRAKLQPFVMMRVTDAALAVAQATPAAEGELTIEITGDGMVPENNGLWRLHARGGQASLTRTQEPADFSCPVGALVRILTGCMTATEAAGAGLAQGEPAALALLDEMYPRMNNYIFEMY